MASDDLPSFFEIQVYPDEAAAIHALQTQSPVPLTGAAVPPPLPEFAAAIEAVNVEGVTRIRLANDSIRDEQLRPGLLCARLVSECGADRLVLNFAGLRPFGHPFQDDIWAVVRELARVKGRLALCCVEPWYLERLRLYPFLRVKVAPSCIPRG
jgi:hypothetical protein